MSSSPTTREELGSRLHERGVHDRAYSLFGAHVDDAIVMDRRPQGWVVFYSEPRGGSLLVVCPTESGTRSAVLRRVTADERVFFDLVAGPAPSEEADGRFDQWLAGVT